MSRKHRNRRIAALLAAVALLVLVCIQIPCRHANDDPTLPPAEYDGFFLTPDTRNASPNKNLTKDATLPEREKAENVKEIRAMRATAYDLSIKSCGKSFSNPSRGITASGKNLTGLPREDAMTVSSVEYPLGTKLSITFPEPYEHFSGIYFVADTGAFRNGTIDVYLGDFGEQVGQEVWDFGVRQVEVQILE